MYEAKRINQADPSKKSSFKKLKNVDMRTIDERNDAISQSKVLLSKNTIHNKTRNHYKKQHEDVPKSLMLAYKQNEKDSKLKKMLDEHKKISLVNLMSQDTSRPSHKTSNSMCFNQIQHSTIDLKKGKAIIESNSFDNIHSQDSLRRKQTSNYNLSSVTLQTINNHKNYQMADFQTRENYEKYKPKYNLKALDNIITAEYYYKNRKEGYLKDLYYQNLYEKYHNLNHPQKMAKMQAMTNQEIEETNPTLQLALKKRRGFSNKNVNSNDSSKSNLSSKSLSNPKNKGDQLPKMKSIQIQKQEQEQAKEKEKDRSSINKTIISKNKDGTASISAAMLELQNQMNMKDNHKNLKLANQLKNIVKRGGNAHVDLLNEISNMVNKKDEIDIKKSMIPDGQAVSESLFKDLGLSSIAPKKKMKLKLKPKRRGSEKTMQEVLPASQFSSSLKNSASIRSNSKTQHNEVEEENLSEKIPKNTESHNSFVVKKPKKFMCCF